ncbi:MAG TPA: protoporphyrinogen oxidase, partial [Polyangiaceae bacterium]|nr:protoporphyrinogen oxidase [Polyangiaceae bacterium]
MAKRVVIVGGGISGLAAAYALHSSRPDLEIRLFEASDRLGGNVGTDAIDDFVVEHGPDSFVVSKPHALALCRKLDLENQLISTPPENRIVYFARAGKLIPLPEGLVLGVPTRLLPLLFSSLLSLKAKLRAALEPFIPVRKEAGDESVYDFFARRLGTEVAARIAGPLIGGIYAGDPRSLSIEATFPQFRAMEQRFGSLILGMLAARGKNPQSAPGYFLARVFLLLRQLLPHKRTAEPAFLSLKGGMQGLIDALARALPQGSVTMSTPIASVSCDPRKTEQPALVTLANGQKLAADAALLCAPTHACAKLVNDAELSAELTAIPTVSTATVVLGFERSTVRHPLQGVGFVVPKGEGQILAATWISSKWQHRAPAGRVLLRAFLGGPELKDQLA